MTCWIAWTLRSASDGIGPERIGRPGSQAIHDPTRFVSPSGTAPGWRAARRPVGRARRCVCNFGLR